MSEKEKEIIRKVAHALTEVIGMVKQWYVDNGYPREISYIQCDGQIKKYHVIVRDSDAN